MTPEYDWCNSSSLAIQDRIYPLATGQSAHGTMKINQDANVYIARLESGEPLRVPIAARRQGYLVCIDGKLAVDRIEVQQRDALKIWGEHDLSCSALEDSHFLMVEMARK